MATFPLIFMCLVILAGCISVHHKHSWCPQKPEVDIESFANEVTDDC